MDGNWTPWTVWAASVTCLNGTRTRTRVCDAPLCGGATICPGTEPAQETEDVSLGPCPCLQDIDYAPGLNTPHNAVPPIIGTITSAVDCQAECAAYVKPEIVCELLRVQYLFLLLFFQDSFVRFLFLLILASLAGLLLFPSLLSGRGLGRPAL